MLTFADALRQPGCDDTALYAPRVRRIGAGPGSELPGQTSSPPCVHMFPVLVNMDVAHGPV